MTERVDLDRLADYVGGALDGTPDAVEVRRLIDTDPGWAAAHEDLAAAMSSVGVELRTFGQVVDAVPDDVVARLDAVLRDPGSSDGAASASRDAESAPGGVATIDPARPRGSRGPQREPARGPGGAGPGRDRKRRTARWAAGLSAAAAVIAFGVGVVATFPTDSQDAGESAAGPVNAQAPAATTGADAATVISGRDYRAGSFDGLADLSRVPAPFATGERAAAEPGTQADNLQRTQPSGNEPPELARFQAEPAVLRDCLDAVRAVFGGRVRVVDLARFEGEPAVIVLLDDAAAGGGRPLVVAAGANCGQPPGSTDELFHGPLT